MPTENVTPEHSIGVKAGHPPVLLESKGGRAPKAQQYLAIDQLENFWAAFGHSIRLGLMPNETLDIHFDRGELMDPYRWAKPCLQAFLKSARQWIERERSKDGEPISYQTAYVWVLENRGDGEGHGIHAHVLIHVPDPLRDRFHQLKAKWARKAGLNMAIKGVIERKHLPTLAAAKGKLKYVSKDLDPRFWYLFEDCTGRVHLDDRNKPSDQPIYGKKCGVSRNIDAKARSSFQGQSISAAAEGLSSGEVGQGPIKIRGGYSPGELAA